MFSNIVLLDFILLLVAFVAGFGGGYCVKRRQARRRERRLAQAALLGSGKGEAQPADSEGTAASAPALAASDPSPGFIDVKKLIADYDISEHARRADEYFKDFSLNKSELRKPFFGLETVHLTTNLGVVLGNLDFFPGSRVLDFGAGTGWLSQSLALMGCRPIAVDVSKRAFELGKTFTTTKYPEVAGQITYLAFDGFTLELPTASVDRVVCMDSFHHVPNQDRVLSEFHRVLTPDGRAVFCEPGAQHSLTTMAQYEMRTFGVIENDIVIEDIWQKARAIGFEDIKLSAFAPQPMLLSLDELATLQTFETAEGVLRRAYDEVYKPVYNGDRLFVLYKGKATRDSRWRDGLAGIITARIDDVGDAYRISGSIKNTGSATWRASGNDVGAVSLGLILRHPDGSWQQDFEWVPFLDAPLPPEGVREFETLLAKSRVGDAELHAELVAKQVTWFGPISGGRVRLT